MANRLKKIEQAIPPDNHGVYVGMPSPTGYPSAALTGKALCDWVRNVTPWGEGVGGELAAAYLDAGSAAGTAIGGPWKRESPDGPEVRRWVRKAGELALRDLEKLRRAGDTSERPRLTAYNEIIDRAGVDALLDRIGYRKPAGS